jgi:hypothetical protein
MKKALLAVLIIASVFAVAWAQPKVAVLDSIIPQNMDPSVISPATDRIIEKLVQSQRFTVLDRANIESVLKEREFQVSGMVSDQDAVTAGKYLGADFIVVSKISKVGDTNFMSGKMINVKTGVIVSTTSAQGEGKLAVVINLAGQVGEVLAGGTATPAPAPDANVVVVAPPADVVPVAPPPEDTQEVAPPRSSSGFTDNFVGIGMGFASYSIKFDYADGTRTDTYKENFFGVSAMAASKYIQVGIGMAWFTSGKYEVESSGSSLGSADFLVDYSITYLTFDMLFRIPIKFGKSLALVPLFGMEYDLNLSYKDATGTSQKGTSSEFDAWLNHFLLQVGAGLQINAGNLVLYPEMLYGWKLKSAYDSTLQTSYTIGGVVPKLSSGQLSFNFIVGFKI